MTNETPRALRIAGNAVDATMALLVLFIVYNAIDNRLVYVMHDKFFRYTFGPLFWLLLLRSAMLLPWRALRTLRPPQWAVVAFAAVAYVAFLWNVLNRNFPEAMRAIVVTRTSFQGYSDFEVAKDITDWNKYYPRAAFVEELKAAIPEDAGILYFGDQRGHIISYLLYPRRVYMLPELQIALNWSVQENWTWTPMKDPFHALADPLNPTDEGLPQNIPNEKMQRDAIELIRAKKIGWVVSYDSMYPERCWFRRIDPAWSGS